MVLSQNNHTDNPDFLKQEPDKNPVDSLARHHKLHQPMAQRPANSYLKKISGDRMVRTHTNILDFSTLQWKSRA